MRRHPNQGNSQQIVHRLRNFSEAIQQLVFHVIPLLCILNPCNSFINIQLLHFIYNIGGWNKGIHIQIDHGGKILRSFAALQHMNRFSQHLAVQIISNRLHMPVLTHSQQISCSPDLQVPHGNLEPAAQICEFPNGRKPFLRHFLQHLVPSVHQKCIGRPIGTSHPASELIKLRESQIIGIMNNHGVHIGNVQTCLYNGCGHQHIDFPVDKIEHNFFQLMLLHLTVGIGHSRLRHQRCNLCRHIRNIVHTIVYIIHLPASGQLSGDGLPHQLVIIFTHKRLNGLPVSRGFLQNAHISNPNEAHVKGPWNRCGRQRQHIHIFFQLLNLLLMRHTEPLLLINNQQSQVLKLYIRRQNPVGADNDIHLAL